MTLIKAWSASQLLTWWLCKMVRIGWVACSVCGQPEASVTENATGTLSVSCHKCQFSGYAKSGTKAARLIREKLRPDEDAVPKTANDPKTAPAKKRGFFELDL